MVTLACVAVVCASALLGLRWVLDARKAPAPDAELRARVESLEAWRSRNEAGKLR